MKSLHKTVKSKARPVSKTGEESAGRRRKLILAWMRAHREPVHGGDLARRFRVSRQSLVVARSVAAGAALGVEDLTVQRPGTGVPAAKIDEQAS